MRSTTCLQQLAFSACQHSCQTRCLLLHPLRRRLMSCCVTSGVCCLSTQMRKRQSSSEYRWAAGGCFSHNIVYLSHSGTTCLAAVGTARGGRSMYVQAEVCARDQDTLAVAAPWQLTCSANINPFLLLSHKPTASLVSACCVPPCRSPWMYVTRC